MESPKGLQRKGDVFSIGFVVAEPRQRAAARQPGSVGALAVLMAGPQAAEVFAAPDASVLTWIWAGAPVAQDGDPVTGEGVLMQRATLLDRVALLAARRRICGTPGSFAGRGSAGS